MQLIFGVVSYIFILFGMYQRSVISFILAPLSIAMLIFHYNGCKIISVVLMLLQGILTAFMVYLRMQGIVQSDYLLYVSAISILMLFSILDILERVNKIATEGNQECHIRFDIIIKPKEDTND